MKARESLSSLSDTFFFGFFCVAASWSLLTGAADCWRGCFFSLHCKRSGPPLPPHSVAVFSWEGECCGDEGSSVSPFAGEKHLFWLCVVSLSDVYPLSE